MQEKPPGRLPRALRGRMGEANTRFVQGKQEKAIWLCLDIIRQAPLAYEPFSTLAMIHEDQGDMEKSLRLAFTAAHLNPSDTEEWARLAEMSLEQDNIKQAIFCYTQALKYEPTNIHFLWERSSLCEQMGDREMAMDGYRRILNLLPASDGERFLQLARDKAKGHWQASEGASAISMIEEAFSIPQTLSSMEGGSLTAGEKALQVTVEFPKVVLDEEASEEDQEAVPLEEEKKGCSVIWMGACP
ncbi:general transcription factor 3C polypeptide 3 [Octodon degus]|uniref:General transcription factor 3C polypeptide 3 n=1 Tax=Octodon degus TaxID=10160 RepID=A0A6P6E7U0_OCTDE|nr:general transcription factor 3C polypeptide 3 [Octodon degus]